MIIKSATVLVLLLFAISSFANNILMNGDFESGLSEWSSWFDSSTGYNGTFQINNSEVYNGSTSGQVIINSIGNDQNPGKIMVRNTSFELQENIDYKVTFFLKSNSTQDFLVHVHQDSSPYERYGSMEFTASPNWQQYSFIFRSPVSTSNVRFAFNFGTSVATYYFDDIEIIEFTQVYDTVIDPDYSVDWSRSGVPGGIPNVPATVNVLDYGAVGDGTTDNLAAFDAALSATNSGEAVFIPAGTYRINGSLIIREGRVLRGECPSNTRLEFEINADVPCIYIANNENSDFQPIISGFEKGSNVIMVSDPADFSVGGYLEIQQENDSVLMYTDPFWEQSWAANAVGQLFKITAISGNQIELDRPVFHGLNADMNPEVHPIELIEEVGIEDLYLERLDASDGATIYMQNAARCWVKNIESNMTYRSHVNLTRTIDCEVRGSYFHHSHDYGGGGHGYGVALLRHTTSTLIENNVFEYLRHAMLTNTGVTGNVFGYNFSIEPNWQNLNIPSDISMHGHFPTMNLFEGNILEKAYFSDWWGPVGPGNTMFRNRVTTSDITVADHSHHQNVIANELTGEGATVLIESSVQNTWSHSNNENGIIRATTTAQIPASLYHTNPPDFMAGYPFPAFGPELTLGANSIPAQGRFQENTELCSDICPNFDDNNTQAGTGIAINLKAYLQGAYQVASGEMTTMLNTSRGLLPGQTPSSPLVTPTPAGQPYGIAPWNYVGTEGADWTENAYTTDAVDWVLVSLRTSTTKASQVAISAGVLNKDGSIYFPDRCALSVNDSAVYVVVEHRNHIGIMTPQPISITNNMLTYDFTQANTYDGNGTGAGQIEITSGVWAMYAGDADQVSDIGSYDINGPDKSVWFDTNGVFDNYLPADFNLDGDVNGQDKSLWFDNNGVSSRVPK